MSVAFPVAWIIPYFSQPMNISREKPADSIDRVRLCGAGKVHPFLIPPHGGGRRGESVIVLHHTDVSLGLSKIIHFDTQETTSWEKWQVTCSLALHIRRAEKSLE